MKSHVLSRGFRDEGTTRIETMTNGDIGIVHAKEVNKMDLSNKGTYASSAQFPTNNVVCSIPKSKIPELITFLQGVA